MCQHPGAYSADGRASQVLIHFSDEDQEWVATTSEFRSLSWLEESPVDALAGPVKLGAEIREGSSGRSRMPAANDENSHAPEEFS
jgi:hypothetical protein